MNAVAASEEIDSFTEDYESIKKERDSLQRQVAILKAQSASYGSNESFGLLGKHGSLSPTGFAKRPHLPLATVVNIHLHGVLSRRWLTPALRLP